jgi:hypothetical protein
MLGVSLVGAGLGSAAVASAAVEATSISAEARLEAEGANPVSAEAAKGFTYHVHPPSSDLNAGGGLDSATAALTTPAALAATPSDALPPVSLYSAFAASAPTPSASATAAGFPPADRPVAAGSAPAALDGQTASGSTTGAEAARGNPVRMTTFKVRDMSNEVYEDLRAKLAREAYERTLLPLYSTDITTDVRFASTTIDRDGSRRVSGLSLLSTVW